MTNREWLMEQMQNMSDEELAKYLMVVDEIEEEYGCRGTMCSDPDCTPCVIKWLKAEHKEKPKLTEAERVILENIDEKYKWIARDSDRELRVFWTKPSKDDSNFWNNGTSFRYLSAFNHLFQFIKWEDENPYNIEELLKGE